MPAHSLFTLSQFPIEQENVLCYHSMSTFSCYFKSISSDTVMYEKIPILYAIPAMIKRCKG